MNRLSRSCCRATAEAVHNTLYLDFLRPAFVGHEFRPRNRQVHTETAGESSAARSEKSVRRTKIEQAFEDELFKDAAGSEASTAKRDRPKRPSKSPLLRQLRQRPFDYAETDPVAQVQRLSRREKPTDRFSVLRTMRDLPGLERLDLDSEGGNQGENPVEEVPADPAHRRNKSIENIMKGLLRGDWQRVFYAGLKRLDHNEEQRFLEISTLDKMVRLLQKQNESVIEKDWAKIRDALLVHIALREWLISGPSAHSSIVGRWAFQELNSGTEAGLKRVLDFWQAFLKRMHKIAEVTNEDKTQRYEPLELPTSLFTAIVIAHALDPEATLLNFVRMLARNVQVPSFYSAPQAKVLGKGPLHVRVKVMKQRHGEPLTARVNLWLDQMEYLRVWARGADSGVIASCQRWRQRLNASATITTWNHIKEGLTTTNEEDKWMQVDWTTKDDTATQKVSDEAGTSLAADDRSRLLSETISDEDEDLLRDSEPLSLAGPMSPHPPSLLTPALVGEFLHTFLHLGLLKHAARVWQFVTEELGLKPTRIMWTGLLLGYSHLKDPQAVESTFTQMQEDKNVTVDAACWSILINAYFRAGQAERGLTLAKQLVSHQELREQFPNGQLPTRLYNVIMHGLLWGGQSDAALDLLRLMREQGVTPDIYTVNVILRYYSRPRSHSLKGISETLKLVEEFKLTPDVVTFTTLLDALLRAGRQDAAQAVQQLMHKMGVKPNVITLTSTIHYLAKSAVRTGNAESLETAVDILRQMQADARTSLTPPDQRVSPTEVTYTALIQGFAQYSVSQDSREHLEQAETLLREMFALGLQPNRVTYNALMAACIAHDEVENAFDYFSRYRAMKSKRHSSNVANTFAKDMIDEQHLLSENIPISMWQNLLSALVNRKRMGHAMVVLTEMRNLGIQMNSGSLQKLEAAILAGQPKTR